jgi:hypothetical protein
VESGAERDDITGAREIVEELDLFARTAEELDLSAQ